MNSAYFPPVRGGRSGEDTLRPKAASEAREKARGQGELAGELAQPLQRRQAPRHWPEIGPMQALELLGITATFLDFLDLYDAC